LRHVLAGGHQLGARVRASRTLGGPGGTNIVQGAHGVVIGPCRQQPRSRLLIRFSRGTDESHEEVECEPDDVESAIPGDFRRGNIVVAARDLHVGGAVVVREGVIGTVVSPSGSDSQNRVTVSFSRREDGSRNRLNCVLSEIRLYIPGGFEVNARVRATRTLTIDGGQPIVPSGSHGVVVGPAPDDPLEQLLVRFDALPLSGDTVECACGADDVALLIAGGFLRGESVAAAKDLCVKGVVVVKQGVLGTVVGQSATDPNGRVTIAFVRREDGRGNNLNVVPTEIHRMLCTGNLVPGDQVTARRQLLVVPAGAHGTVLGPSCTRPSRVAVRFDAVDDCDEVVLHVEPRDLDVLAASENVDRSSPEPESRSKEVDGKIRAIAGNYVRGNEVIAARDLSVGGNVVVRAGVLGMVIGPSNQDIERVTVAFAWREDGKTNNLNVVPSEIRSVEAPTATRGEVCAICLGELLSEGEELCRMPCSHVLHATCVRAYLSHQTSTGNKSCTRSHNPSYIKPAQCPVCRRDTLP